MPRTKENSVTVEVLRHEGVVCADLSSVDEVIQSQQDGVSYGVVPSSEDGLSYLRLAAQVYSRLVVLGKPCFDLIIYREPSTTPVVSAECIGNNYPISTPAQDLVIVGSEEYNFGDGSADFYGKYGVVAVGGTFDKLHAGHRLLLTAAAWAARDVLRIGITSNILLKNKKFKEFISSYEERSKSAKDFARRVKPSLQQISCSELRDPAGPSATDPSIEALVVSSETAKSAKEINERRADAGLNRMVIIEVDVLDTKGKKLSSSTLREEVSMKHITATSSKQ